MKLLVVAKPWRGGLGTYVYEALCDLIGVEQVTYIPTRPQSLGDKLQTKRDKRYWSQKLLRNIEHAEYDAAIFITPPETVVQLPNPQKNILWLVDDARISPAMTAAMGHIFLSDPGYVEELKASIPADHFAGVLPFAMLPSAHCPSANPVTARDAMCFIANHDAKRDAWLAQIAATEMQCHVYGNYFLHHPLFWKHPTHYHPRVAIAQMQDVYARHRLSLNLHAQIVRAGTNMRSFEAAGYGTPQLVEYRPGMEALFDLEKELLCFTPIEEMQAHYTRLLRDRPFAEAIAHQARARVLAEHTYQHRVKRMLERI